MESFKEVGWEWDYARRLLLGMVKVKTDWYEQYSPYLFKIIQLLW